MQVRSLGWEDPLQKDTATHSSILAWRVPWTEEPSGLQSTASQRVGHYWSDLALPGPTLQQLNHNFWGLLNASCLIKAPRWFQWAASAESGHSAWKWTELTASVYRVSVGRRPAARCVPLCQFTHESSTEKIQQCTVKCEIEWLQVIITSSIGRTVSLSWPQNLGLRIWTRWGHWRLENPN